MKKNHWILIIAFAALFNGCTAPVFQKSNMDMKVVSGANHGICFYSAVESPIVGDKTNGIAFIDSTGALRYFDFKKNGEIVIDKSRDNDVISGLKLYGERLYYRVKHPKSNASAPKDDVKSVSLNTLMEGKTEQIDEDSPFYFDGDELIDAKEASIRIESSASVDYLLNDFVFSKSKIYALADDGLHIIEPENNREMIVRGTNTSGELFVSDSGDVYCITPVSQGGHIVARLADNSLERVCFMENFDIAQTPICLQYYENRIIIGNYKEKYVYSDEGKLICRIDELCNNSTGPYMVNGRIVFHIENGYMPKTDYLICVGNGYYTLDIGKLT